MSTNINLHQFLKRFKYLYFQCGVQTHNPKIKSLHALLTEPTRHPCIIFLQTIQYFTAWVGPYGPNQSFINRHLDYFQCFAIFKKTGQWAVWYTHLHTCDQFFKINFWMLTCHFMTLGAYCPNCHLKSIYQVYLLKRKRLKFKSNNIFYYYLHHFTT